MPTYPIDLPPAAAWYKQVRYTQKAINSFSRNPFSGAQQIYTWGAGWWEVDVLLRPMRRDNATDWQSYLMSLHGKEGTFNFVRSGQRHHPAGRLGRDAGRLESDSAELLFRKCDLDRRLCAEPAERRPRRRLVQHRRTSAGCIK